MTREGPRIVIVGGGFAGLYAATHLARGELAEEGARITLVDRETYSTFTPMLAEVVAGTLGREHVTFPYRALGHRYGFEFVLGSALGLDLDSGVVRTERAELPFDYLVIATGAEPGYFGNDALRAASLPFASVEDALAIRGRVIGSMERLILCEDAGERDRLTTFVVAGGGPAGVEAASEIHTLANEVLRPYYPDAPPVRVVLVDAGERILSAWDADLACAGEREMGRRGIELKLGTRIEGMEDGVVTARRGEETERIPAGTLVWTAGTTPAAWPEEWPFPTDRGAIRVGPDLRVEGQERVYAVGDAVVLEDERTGRPYPRVAPIAMSMGIKAAANVEAHAFGRDLTPYRAHHAGSIVSLGAGVALVDLLGFRITGTPAWWIYRATYLLKLVGLKNKLRVLFTLGLNRVFEPDIAAPPSVAFP